METTGVEPDEARPVPTLDDAVVLVDVSLEVGDAPVPPAFETGVPPALEAVPVAAATAKAVVEVTDWICMESLGWLETVHDGFGAAGNRHGSTH
ncbi:hypothetical protein [Trinickia acidisoli]|uniref:hypothetical protein n=1 Tax=Trinickia acidisoli TaxID=2767482 RepID=UPI001A8C5133|nr:hypothetical protein [Trinickia acidisoli]